MSKIGNWVLDIQERQTQIKHTNPYDRHSNKPDTARHYYVDYTRFRDQHRPRYDLVRSN